MRNLFKRYFSGSTVAYFAQTMRNLFKDILVAVALRCIADECRDSFVYCVCRGECTTSVTQRACTVLYRTPLGVASPYVILFPDTMNPWDREGSLGQRRQGVSPPGAGGHLHQKEETFTEP